MRRVAGGLPGTLIPSEKAPYTLISLEFSDDKGESWDALRNSAILDFEALPDGNRLYRVADPELYEAADEE